MYTKYENAKLALIGMFFCKRATKKTLANITKHR